MNSYYSISDLQQIIKMQDEAAEAAEHARRRPRETRHDTTAFYNFKNKRKGKKR